MLSQYYKFLDKKLYGYMNKANLIGGDRYFLILNNDEEIKKLRGAITSSEESQIHPFYSDDFDFSTVYYNVNDLNIVFIFATKEMSHDFLVTIRNRVSLQAGEWKDTVVIFMITEALDSITNGSFDLSKQGAPFHTKSLASQLKNEINKKESSLSESDQTIMKFVVENNFSDEFVRYTLMDFESVFSIIEQAEITARDYNQLGLFTDKQIHTYSENEANKRLEENKELFQTISSYHDRGNPKELIEEEYEGSSIVNDLSGDKWHEVEFEKILKSKEKMIELKKVNINFLEDEFNSQFKGIEVWDKPSGNTKVQNRERNIIIFKENNNINKFILPFSQQIKIDSKFVVKRGLKKINLTTEESITEDLISHSRNKLKINTSALNSSATHYLEFTYKHDYNNAYSFKFRILLVNFSPEKIMDIKTKYKLRYDIKSQLLRISLDNPGTELVLNQDDKRTVEVKESNQHFKYEDYNAFDFNTPINEETDEPYIRLQIDQVDYLLLLESISNTIVPLGSIGITKKINENKMSMSFSENKVSQQTSEYYIYQELKDKLLIEKNLIDNEYFTGEIVGDEFIGSKINTFDEIQKSYSDLCKAIVEKNTLPSLMYFDEEIIRYAEIYCDSIDEVINSLKDDEKIFNERIKSIYEVGLIKERGRVLLSPLHPLILRYEIERTNKIDGENVSDKLLKNYNPANLLPFFVMEHESKDKYYFADYDEKFSRWLIYKPYENTNKLRDEVAIFIIKTRLKDFKQHFKYLFEVNSTFSIKTRFLNLSDYEVILKGVIEHLIDEFQKSKTLYEVNPVDIHIDQLEKKDLFKKFYNIRTASELAEMLDIKISNKLKQKFEEEDLLTALKSKINVYTSSEDAIFHITFYNFNHKPKFSTYNAYKLECSISQQGLLSNNSFTAIGGEYVSGFGLKGVGETNKLLDSALLWNSFISNKRNDGLNPFKKSEVIVNNIFDINKLEIDSIFENTNWVTFIDPSVDLSYFNNKDHDLYVIHYNDQTSSFNYESITVTNNTEQYETVLKEFLSKAHYKLKDINVDDIIRSFNILNGEWLLSIIGKRNIRNNDYNFKEKLSIIAAYKNILSMLENDRILWIPISLEEVIRVSRQHGLDSSTDIFSVKELQHSGSISDDLLFLGLELDDEGSKFHMLPVEVKIGHNRSNVVVKAREQIQHVYNLLNKEIIQKNSENQFTQNFYRIFFVNLYFGNLKKFMDNDVVISEKSKKIYEKRTEVLNEPIHFSNVINEKYSLGLIQFFDENLSYRKIVKQEASNIYEIHFTEMDAYTDATKNYGKLNEEMKNNEKGIDMGTYLSEVMNTHMKNKPALYNIEDEDYYAAEGSEGYDINDKPESSEEIIEVSPEYNEDISEDNNPIVVESADEYEVEQIESKDDHEEPEDVEIDENNLEDIRILLGKIDGSNEDLYWEFGNKNLSNRHLLITGKSGQGKTYFMQCLLYELSKNNIDSLIIDYTDGFLPNQLESTFVKRLGEKLETRFIYRDKLPINPFKRNEIDLGGFSMPETDDDISDRVVQIIDFVFNLGIQQNSQLKEAIKIGLAKYNEDLTFTKIKNDLLADESNPALNLYGRIRNLLDRDPFDYNNKDYKWSEVFDFNGNVNIIQLKGFSADIQKVITEFLLWDLYNFSQREGHKNLPIPVLLDEMQNLNHKESSPTTKILKEGRKFGWSSWLATQSLSSIKNSGGDLSSLYNAAQQIHFASPEDQVSSISKTLSTDNNERKVWESKLAKLNKGQCIVHGSTLSNGEFGRITEVVNITSLEDRD